MGEEYQITRRKGNAALRQFLAKEGTALLPMDELIETVAVGGGGASWSVRVGYAKGGVETGRCCCDRAAARAPETGTHHPAYTPTLTSGSISLPSSSRRSTPSALSATACQRLGANIRGVFRSPNS